MFISQKCYQNVLDIILIASLASSFVLIQPGYSTITNNNGSNTSNNNLDVSKEVFVADYANIRIQKFDTDGKFITKWGTEGDAKGQFKIPHSVAVDSSGLQQMVNS
ncbi:MAG: pknD 4 [Nitrososphaeraceae archaeon]|nr:pknD 4 [Nitrososphaeraceae archaeon]